MTITEAQKIIEERKQYLDKFMALPNVVTLAIGEKIRAGVRTGQIAIIFLVKKKVPESELRKEEIIPNMIKGYPTDVVEVGSEAVLHSKKTPICTLGLP